jgi:hypothetical protein
MKPCPEIHVFHSTTAPAREAFIAFFYRPTRPDLDKGIPAGQRRLDMIFTGRTKDSATANAKSWWAEQQAKAAKEKADAAQRAANMKAKRIAA